MTRPTLRRALHSLTHPLTIAAILLLLFNDHYLRYAHPSWLTGKLGDFTWLIFAPFVLAVMLAMVFPRRDRLVIALSVGTVGVWFATAKTIPAVHALTMAAYRVIVGWEGTLRTDPTDLYTLPALLLSVWVWHHAGEREMSLRPLAHVAFALAIVGTLATSPAPVDRGITRICTSGTEVFAIGFGLYDSDAVSWDDESNTWISEYIPYDDERMVACREKYGQGWQDADELLVELTDGTLIRYNNGEIQTRIDEQGWTTEKSLTELDEDARQRIFATRTGRTLTRYSATPYDIQEFEGDVYFAMGLDGILVRRSDGTYKWQAAGDYRLDTLLTLNANRSEVDMYRLLLPELQNALALFLLVMPLTIGWTTNPDELFGCSVSFAMLVFIVAHLSTVPFQDPYNILVIKPLAITLAWLVGTLLTVGVFIRIWGDWDMMLLSIGLAALTVILYMFPYTLWIRGHVGDHFTAGVFAGLLALSAVISGYMYMQRALHPNEKHKGGHGR